MTGEEVSEMHARSVLVVILDPVSRQYTAMNHSKSHEALKKIVQEFANNSTTGQEAMQTGRVEAGAAAPTTAWPPLVAETSEDSWEECGAINAMGSQQCWTCKGLGRVLGLSQWQKQGQGRIRMGQEQLRREQGQQLRDVQGMWKGEHRALMVPSRGTRRVTASLEGKDTVKASATLTVEIIAHEIAPKVEEKEDPDQPRVRPIAIQEALVKIVESANIVELLSAIRPVIGPRQFGVGPSGNPHFATELIRAASDIYLSLDMLGSCSRTSHAPARPRTEVLGRRSSGLEVAFLQPRLAPWLCAITFHAALSTGNPTTDDTTPSSRPSRPSTSLARTSPPGVLRTTSPWTGKPSWTGRGGGWQLSVPSVSSGGPQAAPSTPRRTSHSISRQDASHLGR